MNKLKIMLCAVFTLSLVNTAQADSSNFAGPYIGLSASAYGISAKGSAMTGADTVVGNGINEATVGKTAGIVGGEIGYAIPLGSRFLIDIGASYLAGEAKMEVDGDDKGSERVSFKIDDLRTYYISPQVALSDTSAIYLKVGLSEADTGVTGDVSTPGNLSGTTWALGLRTVLGSGIFLRSEAGFTEYNGISATGLGSAGGIASSNTYSAEPNTAYGMISMGFRF